MPKTQLSCDRLLALLYDKETREVDISSHRGFVQKRNGGRNFSSLSIQSTLWNEYSILFLQMLKRDRSVCRYTTNLLSSRRNTGVVISCCPLFLYISCILVMSFSVHHSPKYQMDVRISQLKKKTCSSEQSFFRNSLDSLDFHDFVDVFIVSCQRVISCLVQGVEALLAVLRPGCETRKAMPQTRHFFPIKEDTRYTKIDSKLDITKRTCAACEFSNYVFSKRSRHKFGKGASWIASYVPLKWFLLRRLGQNSEGEACCWNWWTLNCSTNWINRICSILQQVNKCTMYIFRLWRVALWKLGDMAVVRPWRRSEFWKSHCLRSKIFVLLVLLTSWNATWNKSNFHQSIFNFLCQLWLGVG